MKQKRYSKRSKRYFKTQSFQMLKQKKRNPEKFKAQQLERVDKFLEGESVLMKNRDLKKRRPSLICRYANWEYEAKKRKTENFLKELKKPKFKPKCILRKNHLNETKAEAPGRTSNEN